MKLAALVDDHWGKGTATAVDAQHLPGGAALSDPARAEARGWVLIDDGAARRLGPALAWAWQARVQELHILVSSEMAAGVVARRAGELSVRPEVWLVAGRSVTAARPLAATLPPAAPVSPYADVLRRHGCSPVVEGGVLVGEVLGLEVARVVDGVLEVGVGRHDRYARAAMRPGEDPQAALEEAVAAVRAYRRPGAARHPANTMRRSRWLRSVVCARPDLVGAEWLEPAAPPLAALDLMDNSAVPCVGPDVVVVCSAGVDLDLVPTAADCRLLHGPGYRLAIVVPEGDDVAVTRELAAGLARAPSIVTVPRAWEGLSSLP